MIKLYALPFSSETLLDAISTALIVIDQQGHLEQLNTAAEILLGNSRKQLYHRTLDKLIEHPNTWHQLIHHHFDSGLTERNQQLTLIPTQTTIEADITLTPISSGYYLLDIRPLNRVHAISRTNERQQQAKHNRLIIRNLAHEIRNPLAGIKGAAQRLSDSSLFQNTEKQTQYLTLIMNQVDRLNHLLIQMSGEHPPQYLPTNIHQSIEESLAAFLANPSNQQLTIERQYDPSLPEIPIDEHQIQQVILNLLENAAKATDYQGNIQLTTSIAHQYTLQNHRHKTVLTLKICDNGCGIPDELQTAIFQPMVSHFREGSGLGLAITQNIIHQHGGAIELQSRSGHTCFTLIFPLTQENR
ncbi:nitrogen regulation protein NR(II) [Suttonella ornithocola]|uniref:Sensory histidine kinase/phosphatase NtrB n=1 Tax=Suttonella ornithocola TaxID=279832 RepID=A0A380MK92_9GAMM|nr:nitrogen regulation protein NR(II) [Suttonella ornithocola]SUO93050.1 Nitrogen regulation protein NR(II) [Suttonella ornithocola]